MKKQKIYDIVKRLLQEQVACRNSDKQLQWQFLRDRNFVIDSQLSYWSFMNAPSMESIRRCRQKIQEKHPELGPTNSEVVVGRKKKEDTKSTFIYREEVGQGAMFNTNQYEKREDYGI
jgi:hypothetical protein